MKLSLELYMKEIITINSFLLLPSKAPIVISQAS